MYISLPMFIFLFILWNMYREENYLSKLFAECVGFICWLAVAPFRGVINLFCWLNRITAGFLAWACSMAIMIAIAYYPLKYTAIAIRWFIHCLS
ncbi:hypothetical protein NRB36_004306 [Salmonella enterica]|nr:hypothetical protein [Salmonella enterica]EJO1639665.1 hypothetical protein [Salmonella enterica]